MAKATKLQFTRGSYGELDPHALGEGWCAIAANVRLDSGIPKPVYLPVSAPMWEVYTAPNVRTRQTSVPANTVQAFQFQGAWYFSTSRRDYAAEKVGSHERVYWADGNGNAKKIINGVEAALGITPPSEPLVVTVDPTTIPSSHQFKLTPKIDPVGGNLPAGEYAYRVGTTIAPDINTVPAVIYEPGPAMTCKLDGVGYIEIEWPSFTTNNMVGNVAIYGRNIAMASTPFNQVMRSSNGVDVMNTIYMPMQVITDPKVNTWTDRGSTTPESKGYTSGWNPTWTYIPYNPATVSVAGAADSGEQSNSYAYSFYRVTNGHLDESGLSPVVTSTQVGKATISRMAYASDGPFSKIGDFEESAANLMSIGASPTAKVVASIVDDAFSENTYVVTDPSVSGPHGLSINQAIALVCKQPGSYGGVKRKVFEGKVSGVTSALAAVTGLAVSSTLMQASDVLAYGPGTIQDRVVVNVVGTPPAFYGKNLIYKVVPLVGAAEYGIHLCAAGPPTSTATILIGSVSGYYQVDLQWTPTPGVTHYGIWVTDAGTSTTAFIGVVKATYDGSDSTKLEKFRDTGKRNVDIAVPSQPDTTEKHVFKMPKSLGLGQMLPLPLYTPGTYLWSTYDTVGSIVTNKTFTLTSSDATQIPAAIGPGSLMDFSNALVGASPDGLVTADGYVTLPTGMQAVQSKVGGVLTVSGVAPDNYTGTLLGILTAHLKIPYGQSASAGAPLSTEFGWKLYKAAQGKDWGLMATLPNTATEWVDDGTKLPGEPPDSWYTEDGVQISFNVPPDNLRGPELHGGMLWAISGNTLRWTPVNRPDAWPDAFLLRLSFEPVRLVSDSGSLFVFSPDGIFRVEIQAPTRVRLSKTQAEYGCNAPHSIQPTNKGIIYLSPDGLCMFVPKLNSAVRLAPSKLTPRFFSAPSAAQAPFVVTGKIDDGTLIVSGLPVGVSISPGMAVSGVEVPIGAVVTGYLTATGGKGTYQLNDHFGHAVTGIEDITLTPVESVAPFKHWWTPTNRTFAYTYLLRDDAALEKRNGMLAQIATSAAIGSPWNAPRSWYHDGKYYLYYAQDGQFDNHATLCLDMEPEDPRLTFVGVKPMDAVVNEFGICYLMLPGVKVASAESGMSLLPTAVSMEEVGPNDDALLASATMDKSAPILTTWNPQVGSARAQVFLDTGPITLGRTESRKKWRSVEFHGRRTVKLRIWSDDIELTVATPASATASETPNHDRRINLPRSCWGYALRSIITGDAELTAIELTVDEMPEQR